MRIRVGGTDREAPGSAGEGLSFMESSNKKELMEADIKVKSLVKAIQVLECFTTEKPTLGISEMAAMLGYNKATVYNIVSTFAALGYLEQNPDTQKYSLGLKFLHFSYIITSHIRLSTAMEPYLQKIADATQETVYFGIHHENRVLYLETRTPGEQFQRPILGEKAPMYCTGLGKCLLAFGKDSYLDDISEPFPPYTVNTITRKEKLLEELEEIRKRGYSTDNMEHEFGISCVAVPLFGLSGEIIGAVSVSGPSLRFTAQTIPVIYATMSGILEEVQYVY